MKLSQMNEVGYPLSKDKRLVGLDEMLPHMDGSAS